MLDKDTIQELHKSGIINKNHVLWWQLGFEGRKIHTLDEFVKGLEYVPYRQHIESHDKHGSVDGFETVEKEASFWGRDDVPILVQDIPIFEKELPCFITIKPRSHDHDYSGNWVTSLGRKFYIEPKLNSQPHIRGLVLDVSGNFVFWYALKNPNEARNVHQAKALDLGDKSIPPILFDAVPPSDFYSNIVSKHFKRAKEREIINLDLEEQALTFVPYHEFEPNKNQVTLYPANVNQSKLDIPVLIRGGLSKPQILGATVSIDDYNNQPTRLGYLPLHKNFEKKARKSLIERLGKI